jgi:hypothetical protein
VHDSRESRRLHEVKKKMAITWVQTAPTHAIPIHSQSLARKTPGNFRLADRGERPGKAKPRQHDRRGFATEHF